MNGWTEERSDLEEERSDGRRSDLAESICRAEELVTFRVRGCSKIIVAPLLNF